MTPSDLLAEHRRGPTAETTKRLRELLAGEVRAYLRKHPAKKLPMWISAKSLRDDAEAALDRAIAKLAQLPIDEHEVAPYAQSELSAALDPMFEICSNDFFNRRRGGNPWKALPRSREVEAYSKDSDDPDYRDFIALKMQFALEAAKNKKAHDALKALFTAAPFAEIRKKTGYRRQMLEQFLKGTFVPVE